MSDELDKLRIKLLRGQGRDRVGLLKEAELVEFYEFIMDLVNNHDLDPREMRAYVAAETTVTDNGPDGYSGPQSVVMFEDGKFRVQRSFPSNNKRDAYQPGIVIEISWRSFSGRGPIKEKISAALTKGGYLYEWDDPKCKIKRWPPS